MKLVYVAGPYSAPNDWLRSRNIEEAREVAAELWGEGFAVFCPHSNSAWMDGAATPEAFYEGTMVILRRCDAVYVYTDRWGESKGARAEVQEAREMGIPIFKDMGSICRWRDGNELHA